MTPRRACVLARRTAALGMVHRVDYRRNWDRDQPHREGGCCLTGAPGVPDRNRIRYSRGTRTPECLYICSLIYNGLSYPRSHKRSEQCNGWVAYGRSKSLCGANRGKAVWKG